jgi:hypothetical protein
VTFYVIATAWMTTKRRDHQTGVLDWIALIVALAIGTACVIYGFKAQLVGLVTEYQPVWTFSLAPLFCLPLWAIFVYSCAAVFPAQSVSRGIYGVCASVCLSLGFILHGTSANLSDVCTQIERAYLSDYIAAADASFLVDSSSVHEYL